MKQIFVESVYDIYTDGIYVLNSYLLHMKNHIKTLIKRSRKIPFFLYNEFERYIKRKKTHAAIINMVSDITNEEHDVVREYYNEISNNDELIERLSPFGSIIQHYNIPNHCLLLYLSCRVVKPDKVVETGVYKGSSSAVTLQALEDNNKGKLFSIDLPGTQQNPVIDSSSPYNSVKYNLSDENDVGKKIPVDLEHRWELHLGRSDELLEPLLNDISPVDIFSHDSDHSYKNMMYEFKTARRYLSDSDLILSDDIDWNDSFEEFSNSYSENWIQLTDIVNTNIIENDSMVGIAEL